MHAVDAAEAESSHELDSVSFAGAIECFDGSVGLLRRKHTTSLESGECASVCFAAVGTVAAAGP